VTCKHTIFTCITCDTKGETSNDEALGNKMYQAVKEAVDADASLTDKIVVEPVKCMGGCEQPCTVAFAAPGKVTWVFTHQNPATAADVVATAKLYTERLTGQMVKEERAEALRKNVFCKIPATT